MALTAGRKTTSLLVVPLAAPPESHPRLLKGAPRALALGLKATSRLMARVAARPGHRCKHR
jgi:hypothetical protein